MRTESICEKILVNTPDLICAIGENGQFVKVNAACRKILGYDIHELEAKNFMDFVHPDDVIKTHYTTQKILGGYAAINFKNRYLHKNGHEVSLTWSAEWSEDEKLIFCTARNTTDQEKQHDKAAEKESFYQALIEHGSDMLALLDENGFYLFVSGAIPRVLGYKPEQLIGTNAFELIHPDDLVRIQQLWSKFAESQASILSSDFRYKTAAGDWIWIEAIVSDQLKNDAIKAYVLSSRDITERKTSRLQLKESEQKYKALFDNNPDIVIFEDTEGLVTKVNQSFKDTFKTWIEEDVIGKPATSFLPPEMATVNEQSLKQALLGSILRYDLENI